MRHWTPAAASWFVKPGHRRSIRPMNFLTRAVTVVAVFGLVHKQLGVEQ